MTPTELGFTENQENFGKENSLDSFETGRVSSEHKDRYTLITPDATYDAEVIGSLRFSAESKNDLPAVGDWVAFSVFDEGKALIHAVYPRTSTLERKAVGKSVETQIIATNIDFGIIVQSLNRDFSINRLERYLTICHDAKIEPIVVLSKIDLLEVSEKEEIITQVRERIKNITVIALSNLSGDGVEEVKALLQKGKTYCLLGSSGVGKSTLINTLTGKSLMDTGAISQGIERGKHVTTHRELIVMENGIMIDNPGMREVGITSVSDGLEMTFDEISSLAEQCKFSDCTHTNEKGCAVLKAIEEGEIPMSSYDNYLKLQKEKSYYESNALERKQRDKSLGKMYKRVQEQKRKNKY